MQALQSFAVQKQKKKEGFQKYSQIPTNNFNMNKK